MNKVFNSQLSKWRFGRTADTIHPKIDLLYKRNGTCNVAKADVESIDADIISRFKAHFTLSGTNLYEYDWSVHSPYADVEIIGSSVDESIVVRAVGSQERLANYFTVMCKVNDNCITVYDDYRMEGITCADSIGDVDGTKWNLDGLLMNTCILCKA